MPSSTSLISPQSAVKFVATTLSHVVLIYMFLDTMTHKFEKNFSLCTHIFLNFVCQLVLCYKNKHVICKCNEKCTMCIHGTTQACYKSLEMGIVWSFS